MKNIEQSTEPLENSDLKHLYLFFYLIPILGFFPSLWTLYRGTRGLGLGTRDEEGTRGDLLGTGDEEGTRGDLLGTGDSNLEFMSKNQISEILESVSDFPSPQQIASSPSSSPSPQPLTPHPSLAVSRLSVTLALGWLLGYLLLNVGAETSEFLALRLLVLNSFLTSGYFLVSIWLMVRLAMGKSVRLPGFTTLAERVIGKHLS